MTAIVKLVVFMVIHVFLRSCTSVAMLSPTVYDESMCPCSRLLYHPTSDGLHVLMDLTIISWSRSVITRIISTRVHIAINNGRLKVRNVCDEPVQQRHPLHVHCCHVPTVVEVLVR